MIWLIIGAVLSGAAEVAVVPVNGPVRPGRANRVQVLVTDDRGNPVDNPAVQVDVGTVVPVAPPSADGVATWAWTPPVGVSEGMFSVTAAARVYTAQLPITPLPPLGLNIPGRIDVQAGTQLLLRISDSKRPDPEDLVVHTSEPSQVDVRDVGDALEIRLRPSGTGARVVTVTLEDRSRATRPQIVRYRLYDRQRRTFDLEPGATLRVRLGGREYGPFRATDDGRVAAVLEQWPGERQAELVVRDSVGNELVSPYVLGALSEPGLSVVGRADWPVGEAPPGVYAVATTTDGRLWKGPVPECQIPGVGDAAVGQLTAGLYVIALPDRPVSSGGTRISCSLGQTTSGVRLAPPAGSPQRIELKVWPEQVSLDFPVAEVTVHLLDGAGERLPAQAVNLSATGGQVVVEPSQSGSIRAEYKGGSTAISAGEDSVVAVWNSPLGQGAPTRVQVAHGVVPKIGPTWVYGRALDGQGRPIPGVPLLLSAGQQEERVVSGADGWGRAELPTSGGLSPLSLSARTGQWANRTVAPRGAEASQIGPEQPDLRAQASVRLTTGRVSVVDVTTDSPVLYMGAGAQIDLRIQLTDRTGQPVLQEVPVVSADFGNVSALRPHPDGGYIATYTPPGDRRARTVTVVARSTSGPASGSARVRLEFPPMIASVGVSAGGLTNLGAVNSAFFSLDGDVRLPLNPLFLRVGIAGYAASKTVSTTDFDDVVKRLTLLPVTVAAVARQDRGRNAAWLGLGVALAPYYATEVFDGNRLPPRQGVLTPGVTALVGGGRRLGAGEAILELRGILLVGSSGSGFTGQVGGMTAVVGYRFVID